VKFKIVRVTPRDARNFQIAMKAAALSDYKTKHGALISKGHRVISLGVNDAKKSRPKPQSRSLSLSLHAEMSAIIRARTDLRGATLYSARACSSGAAISKPCTRCRAAILEADIRHVVYHDGNEIIKMKAGEL